MSERLDELIAEIQMLSLSLSTQRDPETRRIALCSIREKSWEATDEIVMKELPIITHTSITIVPRRPRFGVDDL